MRTRQQVASFEAFEVPNYSPTPADRFCAMLHVGQKLDGRVVVVVNRAKHTYATVSLEDYASGKYESKRWHNIADEVPSV